MKGDMRMSNSSQSVTREASENEEVKKIFQEIGVIIKTDNSMFDSEKRKICDANFEVKHHYEVIDTNETCYEIEIQPHKSSESLMAVKIKVEDLKNERWITKFYGGKIHINGLSPKAYSLIRETILIQLKDVKPTKAIKSLGWNGDVRSGYTSGKEIITEESNDTTRLNSNNSKPIPHESINEHRFEHENINEREASMYITDVVFKGTRSEFISITTIMVLLLSLVTSLLHKFTEKPSFVTVFRGLSGSRKSSWLIATLHVLKKYQSQIMANFTGSIPGILNESMQIRDLVFSVDDLFPCGKRLFERMVQMLITLLRVYADNAKRMVYGRTCQTPVNLLVITCEEVPQSLAPSDYARLLVLTFDQSTVNLDKLAEIQNNLPKQNAFLRYYIKYIASQGSLYVNRLVKLFKHYQENLRIELPDVPGRLQSTGAWLISQYQMFLEYQKSKGFITETEIQRRLFEYRDEVITHLSNQSREFTAINPSTIYCKALYEMLNTGELEIEDIIVENNCKYAVAASIKRAVKGSENSIIYPEKFLGFRLNGYYYLINKIAYKAVKRYCSLNDYPFVFSEKRILNILKENGIIEAPKTGSGNTDRIQVNDIQHRVIKITTETFERFANGGVRYGD